MPTDSSSRLLQDGDAAPSVKDSWLRRNRSMWLPVVLAAPYVVGIGWHVGLHPTASVFTGDFSEARRWYIDENSLDPGSFRMTKRYNVVRAAASSTDPDGANTLCDALEYAGVSFEHGGGAVVACQERGENERLRLQIVSVVPSNAAVSPTQEAVVVAVPFSSHWLTNQLNYSILQLIKRLAHPSASSAPWMGSKTVIFVSPMNNATSMHDAVEAFLSLPISRKFIVRNLLVLDRSDTTAYGPTGVPIELRILPQGRHGLLPNMDLVFLLYRIFSQIPARQLQLSIHSFADRRRQIELSWWWRAIFQKASPKWQSRLLDLLLFEFTLARGTDASAGASFLPHAPALDVGIDSLTLQLAHDAPPATPGSTASSNSNNAVIAEVVSKLEPAIRALCNLHERLHHSTSLYLLVSPDRFVKHEEYLVPNLLLLIPLIVRAVTLALVDIRRFDVPSVGRAASIVAFGVVSCSLGLHLVSHLEAQGTAPISMTSLLRSSTVVLATAYVPLLWHLWAENCSPAPIKRTDESKASIQFLACLVALYLHVAILFGHVALAFPSAVLWTPLIAFPSHPASNSRRRLVAWLANCAIVAVTCPVALLVPRVFSTYTLYVQFLYLPLHMFLAILLL